MEIVKGVFVLFHFICWAMVLGGLVTRMKKPEINQGVWHGILGALVTGVLLVGINEMGDDPVNHAKVAVKLLIAVIIAIGIWRGRKAESVTSRYLGILTLLTVVNMAVAILW